MSDRVDGELVPVGGGDVIALTRTPLTMGRRESCDISLQFPNISGLHCELSFRDGYWSVRDLKSQNGTKVNGVRVSTKALRPGDEISIAKRKYKIQYTASAEVQKKLDEMLSDQEDVFGTSLLEKAGLLNPRSSDGRSQPPSRRINLEEDE